MRFGNKIGARVSRKHTFITLGIAAAMLANGTHAGAAKAAPAQAVGTEINVTNQLDRLNGQPLVAVNPKNPANLVFVSTAHIAGGANLDRLACYVAHSQDGGKTWSPVEWPYGDRPLCGDPYLAVDPAGTFFIAYNRLGCPTAPDAPLSTPCPAGPGQVGVSRSTDGGKTWSTPVDTAVARATTPRLRVDKANGQIYVVGGVGTRPSPHGVSVSSDHGLAWSATSPLPPQPFGNQIAVHDGLVATATALKIDGQNVVGDAVKFWISEDQGRNFTAHAVTDGKGAPVALPSGRAMPNNHTLAATDPVPWISADPTHRGRFAIMLPHGNALDVYVTPDAGKTWRGPTAIAAPDAAKPWIEYGPAGELGVMWRTLTGDVSNVYATVSFDGGRKFGRPLKLNHGQYTYGYPGSGGDEWSRILIDGQNVYVTWADARTGNNLDAIVSIVPLAQFRRP